MTDELAASSKKSTSPSRAISAAAAATACHVPPVLRSTSARACRLCCAALPSAAWLTPEWQAKMELIENCKHCGQCVKKCPYTLNTPELLRKNLEDYRTFLK